MSRFSPQVGRYAAPPSLGRGIGAGLMSLGERLREREAMARRDKEIADQRAYQDQAWERTEASNLAREGRMQGYVESRFTRGQQAQIAAEERSRALADADRQRTIGSLSTALRGLPTEVVGSGEGGWNPVETLATAGDPELLRDYLTRVAVENPQRRRERTEGREDFTWQLTERNRLTPRAPVAAPRQQTMMVGGVPHVVDGMRLIPMTGPDGRPVQPTAAPRRETQAEAQRRAFATMARSAATTLGDLDEANPEGGLGYKPPTVGQLARDRVPIFGNVLLPEDYQRRQAATLQLSDAWLRYTSGAAVPEQEVERFAKGFTPRPGDKPETLAQKRAARRLIVDVLEGRGSPEEATQMMRGMGLNSRYLAPMAPATEGALEQIDPDILEALGGY